MSRSRPIVLDRPDQLRAVASPVAHQIVAVMERLGRGTVAELAEHTGVEAGSLYYHVRRLRKVGVLLEHGRRSTGGRQEVVYELAGSEVVLDPRKRSPGFLKELARSVRARLRYLERTYLDALGRRGTMRSGRGRNLSLHTHRVRLGLQDRAELYRRLEELEAFLFERDDPGGKSFVDVTIAVVPVAKKSAS